MRTTIVVRGLTVDLDDVYSRMHAEAQSSVDGRLIHIRGLKYLLAEMYGLHADSGVPPQPLFDLRRETAVALQQLGWVRAVKRNSGRYELIRGGPTETTAAVPVRPEPRRAPARVAVATSVAAAPRRQSKAISRFLVDLSGAHHLRMKRGATTGLDSIGLYSHERPPRYRYLFAQWWSAISPADMVAWVLLNPGVGDTEGTPRTILGRCRNLTRAWGFGGVVIVNLFAFRARDPKELPSGGAAVGPANDAVLAAVTEACGRTLAAWGDGGRREGRAMRVRPFLSDPLCLTKNGKRLTDRGEPFYPKAIAGSTQLLPLL
jgi:hypothetical protein